jgi:hypothetical protein
MYEALLLRVTLAAPFGRCLFLKEPSAISSSVRRAPLAGNMQPWRVYVIAGMRVAAL